MQLAGVLDSADSKRLAFSVVPLNWRLSGLRAVAIAMSPLSRTSCTRLLPNPVEVPVMKKVRGMMALNIQVLLDRGLIYE